MKTIGVITNYFYPFLLWVCIFSSFLFSEKARAQSVSEPIDIIFSLQTINPIAIDSITGLLPEMTSETEVKYRMSIYLEDSTDVSEVKFYMGSTSGATDLCNETISYSSFTEVSTSTYRKENQLKFTSDDKFYQDEVYYEIFIYDLNGDCSYHGTGQYDN